MAGHLSLVPSPEDQIYGRRLILISMIRRHGEIADTGTGVAMEGKAARGELKLSNGTGENHGEELKQQSDGQLNLGLKNSSFVLGGFMAVGWGICI